MSQGPINNITISLQEFLQIPTDRMNISVSKFITNFLTKTVYECLLIIDFEEGNISIESSIQKRYTEFQGFYDSLTYRYQNLAFPTFPSKFQIINQKESRKKFFDSLLKTVVKLAEAHPEIKKELLKLLYEFIFGTGVEIKKLSPEKAKERRESLNDNLNVYLSQLSNNTLEKSPEESILKSQASFSRKGSSLVNDSTIIASMFQKDEVSSKSKV
jgi:hypothetical protein